jgi:hypothetical protein
MEVIFYKFENAWKKVAETISLIEIRCEIVYRIGSNGAHINTVISFRFPQQQEMS